MTGLQIREVTLAYGSRVVLTGISFDVHAGELLGIVGPNGCGKSTLMKGITKVLRPSFGRILLEGKDTATMTTGDMARRVAVVPQNPVLPEAFTAFELVLMGRTPHLGFLGYESARDVSIAAKAMEATRTLHLAERRIGELSGGERQRLTLARALAQEPAVVLLDEPTAHLDINYQIETLDLIARLCAEQDLTAVAALHDLNLAAQYCRRLVMINNGRIHAEGPPRHVITAENVRQVYGADVCVCPHPLNDLPTTLITAGGNGHKRSVKAG